MRKVIISAALFVLAVAALRHSGPALRGRAMAKCQEMFEPSFGERALDKERESLVLATER